MNDMKPEATKPEPPAASPPANCSAGLTRYHLSQSVRGALHNWSPLEWEVACKWITRDDGSSMSVRELKDSFMDHLAAGIEYLAMGECDNFDPKRGCLGHRHNPPNS